MRLALFDLDHTLIPFDSGMAWTRFMVRRGVLASDAQVQYLATCRRYVAGTLDIHALHRATVATLGHCSRTELARWLREFQSDIAPQVPPTALALVQSHRDAGHRCVIVTATSHLVAEPFARLFGISDLLATRSATADGLPGGALTGEIDGDPCYRQHKVTRVNQWLATVQPAAQPAIQPAGSAAGLADCEQSWFYSDSIGDLPLLDAVSHPVAVRPDDRLRAHARLAGWAVLDWA